jgi:hypothetical protein
MSSSPYREEKHQRNGETEKRKENWKGEMAKKPTKQKGIKYNRRNIF